MTIQNYKVYKALAEDITMPYIWVSNPPRPRHIAKITNHEAKKSIFCKVLEADSSFKKRYNKRTRKKHFSESSESFEFIVINGWYRERLGIENIEKEKPNANLEIKQAYLCRWCPLSLYAQIRAAIAHPDYSVKLAVILGILGLALGIISLCR
jgi:hypothetical protein